MADIFISYASQDRAKAQQLAQVLEGKGWSVFWDRTIPPGKTFDQVIEAELDSAMCVVVLWSPAAIASNWVKEEAEVGLRRGILVPALVEGNKIPIGFRRIQAANLTNWSGEPSNSELQTFLDSVENYARPAEGGTAPRKTVLPTSSGPVAAATAPKIVQPEPAKMMEPRLPWFRFSLGTPWLRVALSFGALLVVVSSYLIVNNPFETPPGGTLDPVPVEVHPRLATKPAPKTTTSRSIITDSRTGLMWTRRDNSKNINWYGAEKYCEDLRLAGHSDWRLPSMKELETIYEKGNVTGKWRNMEVCTVNGFKLSNPWIWSSDKAGAGSALSFFFVSGGLGKTPLDNPNGGRVLCVRSSGK